MSSGIIGNGQQVPDPPMETKALVFNNDTGVIPLFTVTGRVWVELIAVGDVNIVSAAAANMRLGVVGNDNAMLVDTVATALTANLFWNDQTPSDVIQTSDRRRRYDISNGANIILTASAQIDSGAVTFYVFWGPISDDGLVEAA
jgi:hypothetical protein